jgi:FlaA1/EpsC-like NDP-sugar epimerase
MSQNIIIFGMGETAHLAYEYFTHDSDDTVVAFCLDPDYITEKEFCGLPVISSEDVVEMFPPDQCVAFAAAGSGKLNRVREALFGTMLRLARTALSWRIILCSPLLKSVIMWFYGVVITLGTELKLKIIVL